MILNSLSKLKRLIRAEFHTLLILLGFRTQWVKLRPSVCPRCDVVLLKRDMYITIQEIELKFSQIYVFMLAVLQQLLLKTE